MRELIERQAALNALIYAVKNVGVLDANDIRTVFKALPTVQPEVLACGNGELIAKLEPQWIPVSERLPEESEYCIITANDGVGHRTTFAKFQKKAKSWNLTGARSYWRVIAWMPLPEPYGKEDVQDE